MELLQEVFVKDLLPLIFLEKDVVLVVKATNEDIARLIGRKGSMASALRQVMSVASHRENKKVSIRFEEREDA